MTDALAPLTEIAVLQSRTLPQLVQREIERLILCGSLRVGERVNEMAIARRLGVSRGPVREALRTLEETGLVRFVKNRGVAVREISPREAADIYEIRAALEALACRRVAETMSDAHIEVFRSLVEQMEQAAASADIESYHPLNVQFHDRLIGLADSNELSSMYRSLLKKLTLFRRHTLGQDGAISVSNAEHRAILQHLEARDALAAGHAMHDHIMGSSHRMQQALRRFYESKQDTAVDGGV